MKTIKLFKDTNCWCSETLIDGKPDPKLVQYFGTHILPTAFTLLADKERVKEEIGRLNPDASVCFES